MICNMFAYVVNIKLMLMQLFYNKLHLVCTKLNKRLKIMITNKLFLSILFIIIGCVSFAQSNEQEQKTELKKAARVEASQAKSQTTDPNDGYMGKKQHILRRLTVSEIPSDCPTYKNDMTKEHYVAQVKAWFKQNENLIKDEFKKELVK